MAAHAAARTGRRLRGRLRGLLLGGLLAATAIFGLLAMHTLNLHGSPALDHSAAAGTLHAALLDGTAHLGSTAHLDGTAHLGTAECGPNPECTSSGDAGHPGLAMACVLALLLALATLIPARLRAWRIRSDSGQGRTPHVADGPSPRPPSLHALCISRT